MVNIPIWPILYGLTSTNKIKQWEILVTQNEDNHGVITIKHGQLDGKIQESSKVIKTGKNLGKKNETTPVEQAISEAQSLYNKKIDEQYVVIIPNGDTFADLIPLPMLAHSYTNRKHDVVFPCFVQPKLNGIRCLAKRIGDAIQFSSRSGKLFTSLDHLVPSLLGMLDDGDTFDGELFTRRISFQEICSAVNREKEENPNTQLIEYHVYDIVDLENTFDIRTALVVEKIKNEDHPLIKIVETRYASSEEELMQIHEEFKELDFEGTMIRNSSGKYVLKHRSKDLQKLKDFLDAEFEIIGGDAGIGKASDECTLRCKTADNKEFDVRCIGPKEVRVYQLNNLETFIGKMLTVKYQDLTDDGIPQFPIGISVRDYE